MPSAAQKAKILRKVSDAPSFRRKKAGPRPSAQLRSMMLAQINKQSELKIAMASYPEFTVQKGVSLKSELQPLMPTISQGVNEYQRLGNSIRAKKLTIRGYVRTSGVPSAQSHQWADVRQIIFKAVGADSHELENGDGFEISEFLEPSVAYTGTPLQNLTPLNGSMYKSFYDKNTTLVQSVSNNTTALTPAYPTAIGTKYEPFTIVINFGKAGKKLTYSNAGDSECRGFPYTMALSQNVQGIDTPAMNTTAVGLIKCSYTSTLEFFDR